MNQLLKLNGLTYVLARRHKTRWKEPLVELTCSLSSDKTTIIVRVDKVYDRFYAQFNKKTDDFPQIGLLIRCRNSKNTGHCRLLHRTTKVSYRKRGRRKTNYWRFDHIEYRRLTKILDVGDLFYFEIYHSPWTIKARLSTIYPRYIDTRAYVLLSSNRRALKTYSNVLRIIPDW